MAENTVTLIGNVTRDPEVRFTPNGAAVAEFGLAVNRRWQNRQTNEWEEQVSFFDVKVWQDQAENVADSIQKGMRAIVTGRLEQRSWETDSGDKRSKIEVVADEVAPSLKWAKAQVTKVYKDDQQGGGSRRSSGSGGGGRSQSSGSSGGGRQAAAFDDFDDSEEPF